MRWAWMGSPLTGAAVVLSALKTCGLPPSIVTALKLVGSWTDMKLCLLMKL